jgi:hypothetical protein
VAGISNSGDLNINRSIIESNVSDAGFGGILNGGKLMVRESIVRDNEGRIAAGGIGNEATATVINSTISSNRSRSAGGIHNFPGATFTIRHSAITENGPDGVVVLNRSTMLITNTTIANNHATLPLSLGGFGSGHGDLKIINSTISENTNVPFPTEPLFIGASIATFGNVELQNAIVASNVTLEGLPSDCLGLAHPIGTITSLGNNIIGNLTGCDIGILPTDSTGDPGLGPFTDDGAPGNGRFPLLEISQAINRGNNQLCSSDPALATDQMDTPRNGPCDIGAVEFYPVVNDLLALANMSTAFDPTPVPGGPAGVFRITADFANTSSLAIIHPFAEVIELTGENLLLNADGGTGGVGARLTLPDSATAPFQPGANSTFEFLIGLQQRQPFSFFVNLLGEP